MRGEGDSLLWVDMQVSPVPWADGSMGLQVTLRDITEQERAAESERALRAQLEHSQRLEAVGRLAGGVAHEFNNLLTVVGGAAELLMDDAEDSQAVLAAEILAAKLRGSALTRQLLAFARKETVQRRRLDLTDVVRELEPLLARFVSGSADLKLDLASAPVAVDADQGQMELVLVNLLVNAKDAMEDRGEVTVGLGVPGQARTFRDRSWVVPSGFVELWVEDTGSGMDEETLDRLFEPFFTTKSGGEGTGLGLATVHGIVTQNGGSIEVMSDLGRGSVFLVRWPAARGD